MRSQKYAFKFSFCHSQRKVLFVRTKKVISFYFSHEISTACGLQELRALRWILIQSDIYISDQ